MCGWLVSIESSQWMVSVNQSSSVGCVALNVRSIKSAVPSIDSIAMQKQSLSSIFNEDPHAD